MRIIYKFSLFLLLFSVGLLQQLEAAKYYWVGNTGNWSQATTHWATTSGGSTFYISAPTSVDSVYIDANSFSANGTISVNVAADCKHFDASGLDETVLMDGSGSINLYGHFYGNAKLGVDLKSNWYATNSSELDGKGAIFDGNMQFLAGSDYELLDTLFHAGAFRSLTFTSCKFITNNYPILSEGNISISTSSSTDSLIFLSGSSLIEAQDIYASGYTKIRWNFEKTTLISTTSSLTKGVRFTIASTLKTVKIKKVLAQGTSCKVEFSGPKFIVQELNCDSITNRLFLLSNYASSTEMDSIYHFSTKAKDLTYRAILHFDTFILQNPNGGCEYKFAKNSEISIGDSLFIGDGLCTAPNTIEENYNITNPNYTGKARWKSDNVDITLNHYNFSDQTATGTATFTVNNAYTTSGNSIWTINSPSGRKLYWVGDNGNYSAPTEWSYNSGGSPLLATDCGPSQFDSVIFDNNSFSNAGFIVTLDIAINSCRFMDWTGVANNPTFTSPSTNDLKVFGSLLLDPNMNVTLSGDIKMLGHFGLTHKIKTANHTFAGDVIIDTKDTLELIDSLKVTDYFRAYSGTFISNDEAIVVGFISMFYYTGLSDYTAPVPGSSFLGKSQITVTKATNNYWNRRIYGESDFHFSANTINRIYFEAFSTPDSMFINSINLIGDKLSGYKPFLDIDSRGKVNIIRSMVKSNIFIEEIAVGHLVADTSIYIRQINSELDTFSFVNSLGGNHLELSSDLEVNDSIFLAAGNCNQKNTLLSSSSNYSYDLIYAKDITLNHYNIIRVSAVGLGNYTSNNTGVIDEPANNWNINTTTGNKFYWVGSTGSWADPTKWSATSGGAPFILGSCTPGPRDSVYFDANSFTSATDSIYGLNSIMACAHMDWTGAMAGATFYRTRYESSNPFWFNGSLIGNSNVNWQFFGTCKFQADSGNYVIQNQSIAFQRSVDFDADSLAYFTLKDSISIESNSYAMRFLNGTYDTEGNSFSAGYFEIGSYNKDSLLIHLGNTKLYQNNITRSTLINSSILNFTGKLNLLKHVNLKTIGSKKIKMNKVHHWGDGPSSRNAIIDSYAALEIDSVISDYGDQVPNAYYSKLRISLSSKATSNTRIHYLKAHELYHHRGTIKIDSATIGLDNLSTTQRFAYNDTFFISEYFKINTSPCNRTTINSSFTGRNALIVATGALAASGGAYIPIINYKDINAQPSNFFDVGLMGSDQGNNMGLLKRNDLFTLTPISSTFCLNNIPDTINNLFFKVGERKLAKEHEWYRPSGSSYIATGVKKDSLLATNIGKHPIQWSFGEGCSVTDTFNVVLSGAAGNITNIAQNDDIDSSWFKCKNWVTGLIPDSFTRTVISNNVTIRINSGDQAFTQKLFIQAGGSLEINGGSLSIWDSFENNGTLRIIGTSDTVFLKGSSAQHLCGSNAVDWNRLYLAKRGAGNVVNKRSDSISNELILKQGNLKMQNGAKLQFKPSSTWLEGGHQSHIEGPVCKTGTDSFVFPTGDNNWWARIGIDAPINISDQFCAERFDAPYSNTVSLLTPLNNVSELEYWNLERTNGTSDVKVKLFWESHNRSSIASNTNTDLTVAHWDGTTWEDAGNSVASTGFNPSGWVESNLWSNFSPFTFGSLNGNSVLPINEIKISAAWKAKNQALVTWSLFDTAGIEYFEIQRATINGQFTTIKTMRELNNSTSWNLIDYLEAEVPTVYYRVIAKRSQQEDLISPTKFLSTSFSENILVYPNPSSEVFSIDCSKLNSKGLMNYRVCNLMGATLQTGVFKADFVHQVEIKEKGAYLLLITNSEGDLYTSKMIVE